MPDLQTLLKDLNISQLIAMGVMFWFFYNRLESKIIDLRTELKSDISGLRTELKSDISNLKSDINKLSDKVEDLDRRLCRIEGSLATQGHCLMAQRQDRKAE